MVLLSFYLIEIRRGKPWRKTWLDSIDHYPTDWLELKFLLSEVMETVYVEHGKKTEALISLERHTSGRFMIRQTHRYALEKIPARREYEAFFRVEYNPENKELTVREANFGFHLAHLREDFNRMERGREYEVPPLIPWEHRLRNLSDPRTLLMEPSGLRYPDYSRKANPLYSHDLEHHKLSYDRKIRRLTYDRGRTPHYRGGETETASAS